MVDSKENGASRRFGGAPVRRCAAGREPRLPGRLRRLSLEMLEDRRLLSIQPFPVPLAAVGPAGSLAYEGTVEAEIAAADETDGFTVDLDDGQTVTIVVDPEATLQPTIALSLPRRRLSIPVSHAGDGLMA